MKVVYAFLHVYFVCLYVSLNRYRQIDKVLTLFSSLFRMLQSWFTFDSINSSVDIVSFIVFLFFSLFAIFLYYILRLYLFESMHLGVLWKLDDATTKEKHFDLSPFSLCKQIRNEALLLTTGNKWNNSMHIRNNNNNYYYYTTLRECDDAVVYTEHLWISKRVFLHQMIRVSCCLSLVLVVARMEYEEIVLLLWVWFNGSAEFLVGCFLFFIVLIDIGNLAWKVIDQLRIHCRPDQQSISRQPFSFVLVIR